MGLDLDDKFGSNPRAEIEGVWQELGDGAAVKVARLGNKEAARAYRKLPKAVRNAVNEGALDDTQAEFFIADYLSKHILKDWRGLSENGKPLSSYSPAVGAEVMKRKRRFRERIWELAADDDLFNVESEEDAKNLQERSDGGSITTLTPSKRSDAGN